MPDEPELRISEPDREPAPLTDPEVCAMQDIATALEPLDLDARRRVLKWALARLVNAPARQEIQSRITGECA